MPFSITGNSRDFKENMVQLVTEVKLDTKQKLHFEICVRKVLQLSTVSGCWSVSCVF